MKGGGEGGGDLHAWVFSWLRSQVGERKEMGAGIRPPGSSPSSGRANWVKEGYGVWEHGGLGSSAPIMPRG